MRDKLSSELYKAVGVPTYSSAYARVMINNDIYGLYSIVDSVNNKWIAPFIHGDDDAHTGTSYKTFSGANLKYLGEGMNSYSGLGAYVVDEIDELDEAANGDDWYRLADFTKLFKNWVDAYENDQTNTAVEALKKFFDLESLLRQMVIESLTFAFDNFWANSGNFLLYYNPEQKKYQIIPYDFDGTFHGSMGSDRFKKNYSEDINNCIDWADVSRVNKDTYFISSLFKHDLIKNRYNEIMKETVNKLFNVDKISPLIDSLSTLIEDDIEWNSGLIDKLDSSITGYVNHFTLENFKANTNFKTVDYNPNVNHNDANFGIKKWIQLRSNQCKSYVKNVSFMPNIPVAKNTLKAVNNVKITLPPVVTTTTTTTTTPVVTKTTKASVSTTTTKVPVITTTTTNVPVITTTTTTPIATQTSKITKITVKKIVTIIKKVKKVKTKTSKL